MRLKTKDSLPTEPPNNLLNFRSLLFKYPQIQFHYDRSRITKQVELCSQLKFRFGMKVIALPKKIQGAYVTQNVGWFEIDCFVITITFSLQVIKISSWRYTVRGYSYLC